MRVPCLLRNPIKFPSSRNALDSLPRFLGLTVIVFVALISCSDTNGLVTDTASTTEKRADKTLVTDISSKYPDVIRATGTSNSIQMAPTLTPIATSSYVPSSSTPTYTPIPATLTPTRTPTPTYTPVPATLTPTRTNPSEATPTAKPTRTPRPTFTPTATPSEYRYDNRKHGYFLKYPYGWEHSPNGPDQTFVFPNPSSDSIDSNLVEKTDGVGHIAGNESSLVITVWPRPEGSFYIHEIVLRYVPSSAAHWENYWKDSGSWLTGFLTGDSEDLFPGYETLSSYEKSDSGVTTEYIRNSRWYLLADLWVEVQITAARRGDSFSFPKELIQIRDSITLTEESFAQYKSELENIRVLATPWSLATPYPAEILSADRAKEILDEIFWNGLPVVRMARTYDDESESMKETGEFTVDYRNEVANLFQTAFYLLNGETAPDKVKLGLYPNSTYSGLTSNNRTREAPAWCCRTLYGELEMVVDAEYPFSRVLGHVGHEMGHARHRLNNDNYNQISKTMKESIAEIFEAAMTRKIGEYAGVNVVNLDFQYSATSYFDWLWGLLNDDFLDIEKPHDRGRALAWLALIYDEKLNQLKQELENDGSLSPESLLLLADYLGSMSASESDTYINLYLNQNNLNDAKTFIKDVVTRRNSTAPTKGLIENNFWLWFLP